jgi:molybdopterin-guanine dinucleotide biosynthesis protein A
MAGGDVVGVILAGGQSRRMGGGDKCLRPLGPKTILQHVIDRARPQVARLVLNANGDPDRFAAYDLPVVADGVPGFAGPLAGVLAGLDWARSNAPACPWVASFAGDAPFLPRDLVARLMSAIKQDRAELACARSDGQEHPVVGLWPVGLADDLRHALVDENIHKVDAWTARHRLVAVDFGIDPVDPFFNANRPEDLAQAERLLPLLRD